MLPNIDYSELPRALQHILNRDNPDVPATPSRRHFLKLAGIGGFALGAFPALSMAQAASDAAKPLSPTQQPSAFVEITADGAVTVTINRLDFGQGVQTALPMILAEELDADWSKVHSKHGNSDGAYVDPVMGLHLTGGSNSIKNSFTQYRELGARARAMLIAAAAKQWNIAPAQLRTASGEVIAPDGRKLGYGELAQAAMAQPVPETVTLKDPKEFRLIGKPTNRLDSIAKSSGQQSYGIDTHLPGQLTAVVLRPPVFGAKIATLDDSAARRVHGVKAVLRVPLDRGAEGIAIIGDGYWSAKQGRDTVKVTWDTSGVEKVDTKKQFAQYRELAKQTGNKFFDADVTPISTAAKKIHAEFNFPYLAHAPMEPLNCTVRFNSDSAELWLGSQMPGLDGMMAARVLGLKPEQVKVNVQMAGGGFGRRAIATSDYVFEACSIAKAVKTAGMDVPVRTMWSREDDIRGGYYRPAQLHQASIGLDAHGKVLAWDHVIVGQSITAGTPFEGFMIKNGIDNTAVEGMREPYDLPMKLTVHHPKLNVPVLWWRSVGSTHTAFVMETLIDEIAHASKKDPVAYRLEAYGDKHLRHRAALQLAVEQSGYGKKSLPKGHAWGVAVHESFQTVVAYVVEASLKNGKPVLHRATAGVHCNLAVNPRTIETQVQGAALMGLSMCLPGAAITFKDGVVEQSNFSDFVVPRITEMPEIAVFIVPSAEPPTGMGEPGLPPLAPAFANAVYKLTGKPIRQLPFNV